MRERGKKEREIERKERARGRERGSLLIQQKSRSVPG